MSKLEEITERLEKTQHDSTHPDEFEKAITDAFAFFGFEAEHVGGSGDTDVFVEAKIGKKSFKAIIDAKTTKNGKVQKSNIDWESLDEHKKKRKANFIIVIGPDFAGGALEKSASAGGHSVSLVTTDELIEILRLHEKCPFNLLDFKDLFGFFGRGIRNGVADLSTKNEKKQKLMNNVKKIIGEMKHVQSESDEGYFTIGTVYGALVGKCSQDEIKGVLKILELPFIDGIERQGIDEKPDGYILTMGQNDIGALFYQISQMLVVEEKEPQQEPPQPSIQPEIPTPSQKDSDYTGKKPISFTFKGEVYEVKKWKDIVVKVSEILYNDHKNEFEKVLSLKGRKRAYYSRTKENLHAPMLIGRTDIYVETNLSANHIVKLSNDAIDLFGYDENSLKITCK